MKKLFLSILISFFVLPFFVIAEDVEEKREVEVFTKIDLRIAGNVFVTQGNEHSLTVKGDAKDLKDLITEVKGGKLVIKYENWTYRHEKVEIHLVMKNIDGVDVSGSGSIVSESKILGDEIEFEVSGSGSIVFDQLEANKIETDISGSGKITLKGTKTVEKFEFEISGSGKVYAFDISTNKVRGEISGSGKVEINALERLDVDISGSGKVYYKGNPVINADISGSGKVVHKE